MDMDKKDFERLKALLEKEGFDMEHYSEGKNTIIVGLKDPWEGVEFAKIGKTHKIKSISKDKIHFDSGNWRYKDKCEPSTEEAYVDQLKKEAFERFGEINKEDRFDESSIYGYYFKSRLAESAEYVYHKCVDILCIGEVTLYRQGQWATKLPKKINVVCSSHDDYNLMHRFDFKTTSRVEITKETMDYLANKLEDYINNKHTES